MNTSTRTSNGAARLSAAIYITEDGSAHPYIQVTDSNDETITGWQLEIDRNRGVLRHPAADGRDIGRDKQGSPNTKPALTWCPRWESNPRSSD